LLVDACDREGIHQWRFLQREDKELFKTLSDAAGECLIFDWRIEGSRIREPRRAIGEIAKRAGDSEQDDAT
jgi:hypothetical protein